MPEIERSFVSELEQHLSEEKPLLQVVLGARQVGKTTGLKQLIARQTRPSFYVSADDILTPSSEWIREQWQEAKRMGQGTLLVIDEIQKVPNWSETLKALWDSHAQGEVRCVLLGSSSLSLQRGLTESLAGRFELLRVPHWSYMECANAFGHDLDTYLVYGGYPGADRFRQDYERWFSYMKSSILDTVIGQDILTQQTVTKPALFRQMFEILCAYPASEVSYTSLLGQLQDRGNTDLVKHYLELYEGAFLFKSIPKFSSKIIRTRSSSPKILPACPSLVTMAHGAVAILQSEHRGHVFEAAVGMDLARCFDELFYWREGNVEVDFVVKRHKEIIGIEVKSGRKRNQSGLSAFRAKFKESSTVIISPENYAQFCCDPKAFLRAFAEG